MIWLGGIVAVLVIVFAVLMMMGVLPMTPVTVGAGFVALAIGAAGPVIATRV